MAVGHKGKSVYEGGVVHIINGSHSIIIGSTILSSDENSKPAKTPFPIKTGTRCESVLLGNGIGWVSL